MAYGLGVTVQVGERGQVYTSDDLDLWAYRDSGTTNSLLGVAFLGNRMIITGQNGTVVWGDTLESLGYINLNTQNWLVGVAASSSLAVAVGDNGAIYSSPDGTNWTSESTASITGWLSAITVGGSAGNTFVAVGASGLVAVRGNNGSWTTVSKSPTTQNLNDVAFINNQYWAVGDNGTVLTGDSAAKNWSTVTGVGATNTLFGVAGTNTSILIVGDQEVRLQDNGNPWTNELLANTNNPAPAWTYYCAIWEGSLFFMGGRSGMMVEGFKTNSTSGLTEWITRNEPVRNWLWDVTRTPNFYVAAGDRGTVMTSADGVSWSLELVPGAATNSVLLGVGGTTNGLVVVGNKGTILYSANTLTNLNITNLLGGVGQLLTNVVSTVGTLWNAISPPTTNDLLGVAVFGNSYVVGGAGGTILTSPDGTTWTVRSTPTTAVLSGLTAFPGGLVATGDRGTILSSTDGIHWTNRVSGTTNWIYRVRYLNGNLVAVGENGTILKSTDGANWTSATSGTTAWLNGVDYPFDSYFAVGNQGTVLQSADLITWTNLGTITQKSLYGVAGTTNQIVLTGVEGVAIRGVLQPLLDPVSFVNFSRSSSQNIYLISGRVDQRVTVQNASTFTNWVDGVTFELLDRSGTLLILENADTNNPPVGFLRGKMAP